MLDGAVGHAHLEPVLLGRLELAVGDVPLVLPLAQVHGVDDGDERRVDRRVLELPDVLRDEILVVGQLEHPADVVALVRAQEEVDALGAVVGEAEEVVDAEVGVDDRVGQQEGVLLLVVAALQVAHEAAAALAARPHKVGERPLRVAARKVREGLRHEVGVEARHLRAVVGRRAAAAAAAVALVVVEDGVGRLHGRAKVGVPLAEVAVDLPLGEEVARLGLVGISGPPVAPLHPTRREEARRHVRDLGEADEAEGDGLLVEPLRELLRRPLRHQRLLVELVLLELVALVPALLDDPLLVGRREVVVAREAHQVGVALAAVAEHRRRDVDVVEPAQRLQRAEEVAELLGRQLDLALGVEVHQGAAGDEAVDAAQRLVVRDGGDARDARDGHGRREGRDALRERRVAVGAAHDLARREPPRHRVGHHPKRALVRLAKAEQLELLEARRRPPRELADLPQLLLDLLAQDALVDAVARLAVGQEEHADARDRLEVARGQRQELVHHAQRGQVRPVRARLVERGRDVRRERRVEREERKGHRRRLRLLGLDLDE